MEVKEISKCPRPVLSGTSHVSPPRFMPGTSTYLTNSCDHLSKPWHPHKLTPVLAPAYNSELLDIALSSEFSAPILNPESSKSPLVPASLPPSSESSRSPLVPSSLPQSSESSRSRWSRLAFFRLQSLPGLHWSQPAFLHLQSLPSIRWSQPAPLLQSAPQNS